MSRGQKPRTPENFPRMRHRAYDRRKVMVLAVDGPPGTEVYGMFWARRRDVPKGSIMVPNPFLGGIR